MDVLTVDWNMQPFNTDNTSGVTLDGEPFPSKQATLIEVISALTHRVEVRARYMPISPKFERFIVGTHSLLYRNIRPHFSFNETSIWIAGKEYKFASKPDMRRDIYIVSVLPQYKGEGDFSDVVRLSWQHMPHLQAIIKNIGFDNIGGES